MRGPGAIPPRRPSPHRRPIEPHYPGAVAAVLAVPMSAAKKFLNLVHSLIKLHYSPLPHLMRGES